MIVINVVLGSPVNKIVPHLYSLLEIKFPSSEESEQIDVIKLLGWDFFIGLDVSFKFGEDLELLL